MPIMMSIRKEHCENILARFKGIEFRKFFPVDYHGAVLVYECGKGSAHKVIAKFYTRNVRRFDPSKDSLDSMVDCFKTADYTSFDVDVLKRQTAPIVCIPIIKPTLITPRTLEEFCEAYKISPVIKPPMSWTRFTTGIKKGC